MYVCMYVCMFIIPYFCLQHVVGGLNRPVLILGSHTVLDEWLSLQYQLFYLRVE
jgi:hypothetical protein